MKAYPLMASDIRAFALAALLFGVWLLLLVVAAPIALLQGAGERIKAWMS